ncbi:MAG: STAS domain-containing protein [Deferribacteraceae bacterium]|jgi:SulP family sulfate permease|nr:STAS domain-containing protein [Deferribacteraceae bacterium]
MAVIKFAKIYPKFFESIKSYSLSIFKKDCAAGLTVGIVAVPLASAFAIASGLEPERGFFTAIVAGFFISFLGGSRYQIGGPTGAFVVIVYTIAAKYGYNGLALATIIAGVILILFAYTRLGSYIKFIPYPVVLGFTAGIAVILFTTELKDLLGLEMGSVPADFAEKFRAYYESITIKKINFWAVGVGASTIIIIMTVRKRLKKIPSHVFAIVLVTVATALFNIPVPTIYSHFGELPRNLPAPVLPEFSLEMLRLVLPSAFTIAILAAIESLLSAVVADGMSADRHDSDTELFGQGVGNILSALFGGIPATGAIARTVTNIKAGGKTPIAGMIHAITILIFILFFAKGVEMIPMAAIAGMLSVISWDMFDPRRLIKFSRQSRSDMFVMLTALLLTVLVDITVAVEVGVVMAALLFIKRMSDVTTLNLVTPSSVDTDDLRFKDVPDGVSIYEINGPFFFGAANNLIHTMESVAEISGIIILRMRSVPVMDTTGLNALETFSATCVRNGAALILSGVQPEPYKLIKSSGLLDILGKENVTDHIDKALARARQMLS